MKMNNLFEKGYFYKWPMKKRRWLRRRIRRGKREHIKYED